MFGVVSVTAPSMPNFTTATLGRRGLNVTWWSQDGASYAAGTTFTVHYRRLGTASDAHFLLHSPLISRSVMIIIAYITAVYDPLCQSPQSAGGRGNLR